MHTDRLLASWVAQRRTDRLRRCVGRHPWEEGCWPDDVATAQAEIDALAGQTRVLVTQAYEEHDDTYEERLATLARIRPPFGGS